MAGNNNIQVADLDFDLIRGNLRKFLESQDILKDYSYDGSALSILLDVLAYNTQYNAYYLNMVANEMFLDSAIQRNSVVSQAKLLGYVPQSAVAPTALINLTVNNVTDSSLTLPAHTQFLSNQINGVSYNFITADAVANNTVAGVVTFNNVLIKQGTTATQQYTVQSSSNPGYVFEIPDSLIDTSTLTVTVQQSSSNGAQSVFTQSDNYLTLSGNDNVYFLQEGFSGKYQIYFGDGKLGKLLTDGNVINISYIVTDGLAASGANNFTIMQPISGNSGNIYPNTTIYGIAAASNGQLQESIDKIKFHAPKSFAAQGRAVTKDDYITAIQQNKLGITFDAVSVWGGEENDVPVYGQVFIALKPTGAYNITNTQKNEILTKIINPISVITVKPTIVDPDYTYVILSVDVLYKTNKTILSSAQLQQRCANTIKQYAISSLNTFNSSFNNYGFLQAITNAEQSIMSTDIKLKLQKKFYPDLTFAQNYTLNFDSSLTKGILNTGVISSPGLSFIDPANQANIIDNVFLEEVPAQTNGVSSIPLLNPGTQYTSAPDVIITGDGAGAIAHAVLSTNGSIQRIIIDAPGSGYTFAIVTFNNNSNDTTGKLASGTVTLQGHLGKLVSYYINPNLVKTILNQNAGTVDYAKGIINLIAFNPVGVNNVFGQFSITVSPTTNIVASTYNRIITLDPFDPDSVTVNIIAST